MPDLLGGASISSWLRSRRHAADEGGARYAPSDHVASARARRSGRDDGCEYGYKGSREDRYGILVPRATPAPIVSRLATQVTKALEAPDVKERMAANGGATVKLGPPEFSALIKRDLDKWRKVIRDGGIKAE